MEIIAGKTYWNGGGRRYFIVGPTKDYPHILYSRQGDWFEAKTGRYVSGASLDKLYPGEHPAGEPSWRDLWSEAAPE